MIAAASAAAGVSEFGAALNANIETVQKSGARIGRFGFGQIILDTIRGTGERDGSVIKTAVLAAYDIFIAPKTPGTEIDAIAHTIIEFMVDTIIARLGLTPAKA